MSSVARSPSTSAVTSTWPPSDRTARTVRPVRIAAIDLGTNSFHLLVADVARRRHFDPLVREKEMLRLGDVVSRDGRISRAAADQAVATDAPLPHARRGGGRDRDRSPARPAPSGSAATASELVDRIEAETGVDVDVIGGHEEARLIFGAMRAAVLHRPGARRSASTSAAAASRSWSATPAACCGRRACSSAWPGSPPSSSRRPTLQARPPPPARAPRRRARAGGAIEVAEPRARSWPSAAAARSRTSAAWSRPAGDGTVPRHREPAHVVRDEFLAAPRGAHRVDRRRAAAHRRASTPGGSTSSRRARCSSPPRWSCSASTS